MRIVHGSDWHGFARKCPEADLYVFTGDMLDNYPVFERDTGVRYWRIDRKTEYELQRKAIKQFIENGGMRRHLGSPDAPVLVVRGNHDFVDLAPMFEGCNFVHEFKDNEVVEVLGLKVSGHRGIPYIYGTWNDEYAKPDLKDRYRAMPLADIYLTHYPPQGILDSEAQGQRSMGGGWSDDNTHYESYGLEGMADNLIHRGAKALHCFGHIHEAGGRVLKVGDVTFSNAATMVNEIEF